MKTSPLISVIIPTYNRENHICDAINSVLAQSYTNIEIIIVDDGSTDNTQQILQQYANRISYLYKENGGVSSARNLGLKQANGELIAFLDSDDIWINNKLSMQHKLLLEHPNADYVMGQLESLFLTELSRNDIRNSSTPRFTVSSGCALFRRHCFEQVGLFNESLQIYEDMDWFYRAHEASLQIISHNHVVQLNKRHDHNITDSSKERRRYFSTRALKYSIERRRKNPTLLKCKFPNFEDYLIEKENV